MALTVTKGTSHMTIVFDGSTAYNSATDYPNGLAIKSLESVPTATDDTITVRETDATGVTLFKKTAATAYDNHIKRFKQASDKRYNLYVVAAQVTSGVMLIVELG